jgi:hypothetical protein
MGAIRKGAAVGLRMRSVRSSLPSYSWVLSPGGYGVLGRALVVAVASVRWDYSRPQGQSAYIQSICPL